MSEAGTTFAIIPGRSLGWIVLGASVHAILTRLKSQPQLYPGLDLTYSSDDPVQSPLILTLPSNGIRLRFDGLDQRLRLIEIITFTQSTFTVKGQDVVRRSASGETTESIPGPSFKHLYNRLFGPSYPGEYIPPRAGEQSGTYVLSWPGLAARFKINHELWSDKADFVSQLAATASPAISLAIFSGSSWPEARTVLYTKRPQFPRSLALGSKAADATPDEIEEVVIHSHNRLELLRRSAPPFTIWLNETTPQELVSELGPPDAIFRKSPTGLSVHATAASSSHADRESHDQSLERQPADQEYLSSKGYTDDSEIDNTQIHDSENGDPQSQMFYNYFHHGFDVLISSDPTGRAGTSTQYVAVKVFLHSNVPGSYSFNRHRKSRWKVVLDTNEQSATLTSDMKFNDISEIIKNAGHGQFQSDHDTARFQQAMVLNRGWGLGDSPENSIELLGVARNSSSVKETRTSGELDPPDGSNTELFGYPGLLFEVLKSGAVCCLTVYSN